jgi:tetratricopeptide (TPR) repeat protein
MNRNDFLNMIDDSVPVNRQMIGEVYELIDIFPYFQSAHMLLLKGLQNNADVKFENQLRNSAIHIADREVLYYLLKSKPSLEKVADKSHHLIESPELPVKETEQTVIESAKNSVHLINEIEKTSDEISSAGIIESGQKAASHSILISTESESEDSAGVMLLMDEEALPQEDRVFYMDPGFSVPEYEDLLELDLDGNYAGISDEEYLSDLIEKFIIANPRIEPNKEKNSLPVDDISKPFVEAEGGFVTETLARIYINQGYYSKAIDIYEKLSLKFPEKSSYFASQIEKVKEYIKK